jgi:hypothetical protein
VLGNWRESLRFAGLSRLTVADLVSAALAVWVASGQFLSRDRVGL